MNRKSRKPTTPRTKQTTKHKQPKHLKKRKQHVPPKKNKNKNTNKTKYETPHKTRQTKPIDAQKETDNSKHVIPKIK